MLARVTHYAELLSFYQFHWNLNLGSTHVDCLQLGCKLTLTTGNFESFDLQRPTISLWKDLDPVTSIISTQETWSILELGFAVSRWPKLHRAYISNRTFIAVFTVCLKIIELFILHFFQARHAVHTNLNVQRDNAFPKHGRATEKTTVEISLMNNIALVRKLS